MRDWILKSESSLEKVYVQINKKRQETGKYRIKSASGIKEGTYTPSSIAPHANAISRFFNRLFRR